MNRNIAQFASCVEVPGLEEWKGRGESSNSQRKVREMPRKQVTLSCWSIGWGRVQGSEWRWVIKPDEAPA